MVLVFLLPGVVPNSAEAAGKVPFSDNPKEIQVASNSVIMLSCYDKNGELYSTGSAFAAFENGVFVTNYHVLGEETYSVRAQMETGLEFNMSSVVAYDAEKDILILRTDVYTGLDPLTLGDSTVLERGEKVIAIGSPLGLINTLSIGLFSGTVKDKQTYLQFSAPISHGSRGGALFNNSGEVVGITAATYEEGQNLNLAIPIELVCDLWESCDKTKELSISDYYNTWEHTMTYTPDYILNSSNKIKNHEKCYVQGYVSTIFKQESGTITTLYLVTDPTQIEGKVVAAPSLKDLAEASATWSQNSLTPVNKGLHIVLHDANNLNVGIGDELLIFGVYESGYTFLQAEEITNLTRNG